MPRLSNADYLQRHYQLRALWLSNDTSVYSQISPNEQWDIHGFFAPSHDWTDEQLIAYRRTVTVEHPSLPHRAGRAVRHLEAARQAAEDRRQYLLHHPQEPSSQPSPKRRQRRGPRHLVVRGDVRPEIDVKLIAKAVVMMALDAAEQDLEAKKEQRGSTQNEPSDPHKPSVDEPLA